MKRYMVLFIAVLFAVFCFSCGKSEEYSTCVMSGGNPIVEYSEGGFSLYDAVTGSFITLENGDFDALEVTLYSNGGKTATLSAERGKRDSAFGTDGRVDAISISADGIKNNYALTSDGLDILLRGQEGKIIVAGEVECDELTVSRAVSVEITGSLTAEKLYCITDDEGKISIRGNVSCGLFAASAPNMALDVEESIIPENSSMYINAKNLNGESLEPGFRYVATEEDLRKLAELPPFYRPAEETVILLGVKLTEDIVLEFPCRLDIEDADLGGFLKIDTRDAGEIYIYGDADIRDFEIDAPQCHFFWDSPCALDKAERIFCVSSFNGYDTSSYILGGDCEAEIVSATMKAQGSLLTEDITWSAVGNILYAEIEGVAAPSQLRSAFLEFETNGGTVTVEPVCLGDERESVNLLEPLGCYVKVSDSHGGYRRYRVITNTESKLPVVVIESDGEIDTREEYIKGHMSVESDFSEGFPSEKKREIEIKGRGNSTWYWSDKKPYKIKYGSDVSLLGLNEGREWVLLANYNDKSLIRNYVALEAARFLDNMDCYATQYPVDVFLNGEYIGVYSLGEQIEVGDNRVSLQTDATDVDTGFFFEIGGVQEFDGPNSFSTRYMECVEILEPSGDSLTDKHKTYIVNYMERVDSAVRKLKGYEDYIDIDSLIDWFILTELSFNSDGAMRRSVFFKKDHGGKLVMGPMWDFDIAFGNSNTDFENYSAWCCLATDYNYVYENWMCRLMEDEAFVERLRLRWNEIKEELLEAMLGAVDYGEMICAHSAKANFKVWDILDRQVAIQPYFMVQYNTYEAQVQYLRDFICRRAEWIDSQLNMKEGE